MSAIPNFPQLPVTRLSATVSFQNYPQLNLLGHNLGLDGLEFQTNSPGAILLPQMANQVVSAEPYVQVTVSIPIIRVQPVYLAWINQFLIDSVLGLCTITPDNANQGPRQITDVVIADLPDEKYDGKNPIGVFTIKGTWVGNYSLYSL